MSKFGISLKIITPTAEIQKRVNKAIAEELTKRLGKVSELVAKDFPRIKSIFVKTDTYNSLTQGPLDAHFGFPKGTALSRLDAIIDTLVSSVIVTPIKVISRAGKLTGGLRIQAFRADFADIFSLAEAKVITEKDQELPWLEWLLTRGDEVIIFDYKIDFGPFGRSGAAIMVKDSASIWRVPPGVSGTIRKNWITKAVDDAIKFIEKFLSNSIEKNIDKVF